jgi:hypothetical protein
MGIRESLDWLGNSPWIGAQDRHVLPVDDWAAHDESATCACRPVIERIGGSVALRWHHRPFTEVRRPVSGAGGLRCPECEAVIGEHDVVVLGAERFVACRTCGQEWSWTDPERPPTAGDVRST